VVMEVVTVAYMGREIGAVSFDTEKGQGAFEYSAEFIRSGIELSPIHMPLSSHIYAFPGLDYDAYKGLPGMIADSLPDDFGNAVLNAWVSRRGESPDRLSPLQRLQYTGSRGMGALEYTPATKVRHLNASQDLQIRELVSIAQDILNERAEFNVQLNPNGEDDKEGMMALLSVGMSAGGARPKAVLAFNDDFSQVRSGQANVPDGFTHYLMKFDGVSEHNPNKETFGDPMGFCNMEYVYSLMARESGIEMMPCHLLREGNRHHFLTQRFDRKGNSKVHVQTLNGLAHVSYKKPGSYSYEELFGLARRLKLDAVAAEQLFRRMVFNVVARNHDDHSKNFAFLLDPQTHAWRLSPAYDVAYSYKPGSPWVNSHWMTLNGKRDNFTLEDFFAFERVSPIFSRTKVKSIVEQVKDSVSRWGVLARDHHVPRALIDDVESNLRLH
jgi:serine/threonine-protein kinase HipA